MIQNVDRQDTYTLRNCPPDESLRLALEFEKCDREEEQRAKKSRRVDRSRFRFWVSGLHGED